MGRSASELLRGSSCPVVVVLQDTREQRPLRIKAFQVEVVGLPVGDYGIKGFSDWGNPKFIVERKSLDDLIGSLNSIRKGKSRFARQIERMLRFDCRALLIEADRFDVESGAYVSQTTPQSILGRVDAICASAGVDVFWCGDPERAARQLESLVRRWADALPGR